VLEYDWRLRVDIRKATEVMNVEEDTILREPANETIGTIVVAEKE